MSSWDFIFCSAATIQEAVAEEMLQSCDVNPVSQLPAPLPRPKPRSLISRKELVFPLYARISLFYFLLLVCTFSTAPGLMSDPHLLQEYKREFGINHVKGVV